ncbi:MAG: SUMF1/EgtB/PvdO family nonheme iron enzyme, partial [Opitutus sp.]
EDVELGDFFLGKYEVTNREYQTFVDAGGYRRQEFWEHPFRRDGTTIPWDEAIKLFTDKTGRPGPSTWIGGTFPDGQEDIPVGGVSWYEAAACARFLGQELPTVYHWRRAFDTGSFAWILPASNVASEGPAKVGRFAGMSWVGAYDMAGNVREWTFNAVGERRFILGGGWSDPLYMAQHMDYAQPPLDRSAINGFRLALTREPAVTIARARKPLPQGVARDFLAETPVSDEVFGAYRQLFSYEPTPLDAQVEDSKEAPYWTRHHISFAGARRGERVPLYLFLPKSGRPPYQTILFWPGAEAGVLESIEEHQVQLDFALKGGRAVALPVFRNTFERRDRIGSPESMSRRDAMIERVNDVRRSLDYLETRADIDTNSLAYFGFSGGSASAPFVLSLEPRLRTAVLTIGGFFAWRPSSPELDAFNYISRVRTPVLLLDGEFDSVFPLETSAKPFFQLLGTPEADKKFVLTPGGHFVPRETLIRETLDWLDRYLGRPAR